LPAKPSVVQFQRAGTLGCFFRFRINPMGDSSCVKFQRLDAREGLRCLHDLPRLPQVIRRLLSQPHFCGPTVVAPQPTLNAQRHGGTDRRPPIEHLGQGGAVDAQVGGRLADLQIQGRQDVVPQSEARVGGIEHRTHGVLSGNPGSPPGWHRRFQKQKSDASYR